LRTLFFFQAEDGIRDRNVTGVQTCALPISRGRGHQAAAAADGHQRGALPRSGHPAPGRGRRRLLSYGATARRVSDGDPAGVAMAITTRGPALHTRGSALLTRGPAPVRVGGVSTRGPAPVRVGGPHAVSRGRPVAAGRPAAARRPADA